MYHRSNHAASYLINQVQEVGRDSEGRSPETLKEADQIAAVVILELACNSSFSVMVREAMDRLRLARSLPPAIVSSDV